MNPILNLIKLGLNEKQAKVYLAGLKLGKATATTIANNSDVKRSTVYGILKELKLLDLCREVNYRKRKYFTMNDPNQLKAMQNDRENILTTMIPFLRSVSTAENIPKISVYQGMDEVKNIYLDTLVDNKSVCSLASSERMEKHFGADWIQAYIKKRLAANVQSRFIATDHSASNFYKNRDESESRETKILPKRFDLALDIEIYKNKVLLMSASENPFAVLIEDDKVSKSLKNVFEFMWSAL